MSSHQMSPERLAEIMGKFIGEDMRTYDVTLKFRRFEDEKPEESQPTLIIGAGNGIVPEIRGGFGIRFASTILAPQPTEQIQAILEQIKKEDEEKKKPKLKPCPRCGWEAEYLVVNSMFRVRCINQASCEISSPLMRTAEDAASWWNWRKE